MIIIIIIIMYITITFVSIMAHSDVAGIVSYTLKLSQNILSLLSNVVSAHIMMLLILHKIQSALFMRDNLT